MVVNALSFTVYFTLEKFFRLHVYHGDENTKPYELVPVCRLFWNKKGDWWYIFRPDLDVHIRIYEVYLE